MIKYSRRLLAMLLCLSMVLGLSACFGNGNDENPSNDSAGSGANATATGAMGRYVEQEEYLPEEVLSLITMAQMPDGSLRVLGDLGGQGIGPFGVISSSDGGKSWESVDYPWLDQLYGCPINTAALTPEGVYISHQANIMGDMPADDAAGESEAAEGVAADAGTETSGEAQPNTESEAGLEEAAAEGDAAEGKANALNMDYTFVYGDASGLTEIPFDYTSEFDSVLTTRLYAASNGDLISVGGTEEILQINTTTWKVRNTYQSTVGIGTTAGVASYGNILAIHSADKIALYDLDSGSLIGDITTIGSSQGSYMARKISVVSIPADGSAYFYFNESGIYRIPMDTTVSERLVDGGLTSLGIQTLSFTNLLTVGSDEYLAVASTPEGGYQMFRYTFNPDIPTEPSQVLGVYSLYDNKTIRQAISGFQTQHPDVRVNYQVGLPEGSGVTAADAMRTLSTELLAGKGPDVIVMDDMDVDGYIQNNVLQDLTDIVSGTDTLPNITGAYNQEGKLYAVPARFSIPMLMGDGVDNVKNLSDFTSWLDTQYTYDIGIRSEELVERFYAACSYRWFTEDGNLDEAAFRSDLEHLGKLAQGIRGVGEIQSFDNIAVDTLLWYGGAISANYGTVSGYVDITLFDVAIKNRPTGSYHPFPNDEGDIYIPGTVLGINAATGSLDNAKSFVQHVLSNEVQATELGDGFPVNSAAFESLSQNPNPNEEDMIDMIAQLNLIDARTGEMTEVSLNGKWPSDEFMTEFKNTLRNAKVPVKANAVIREMIIDETAGFISGSRSLDDTVRSFKQKMDLYLSE